jgi:hypothetical protein
MNTDGKKLIATLNNNQWQSKEILLFLLHDGTRNTKSEYTPIEMENFIISIPSNSRRIVKRYINIMR